MLMDLGLAPVVLGRAVRTSLLRLARFFFIGHGHHGQSGDGPVVGNVARKPAALSRLGKKLLAVLQLWLRCAGRPPRLNQLD